MARKKKFSNPTRISPRTLDKRSEMEPKDLENSEPDDEDTEFEAQELEKEKSTTEADDNENEAENNEVRNIKSKTNQKGKNKMAEKKRKIQKVGGKKTTKAKKRLKVIEDVENQETKTIIRTIKARSSPRDLVKILTGLTHLQQQLVTEMGFESFLNGNFQIETTPTKLGCWVVENFDPDKCVIRMNDGWILITPKMIQDMIGIPMGSIAVTEVPAATTEFPHIVEWRQTYNTYTDARFTIKCVVERLLFDHQLGREFKMNFLVMFFSIIGDCPKLGTVNQRFLECIDKEEDIQNMDWCTYLLGTMKKTRREYKESQGFGGPLVLMVLLYVHATISEQVVVEDQTPLMKSWDTMKLKLREKEELNMGGFGRMRVKEAYRYVEKHRLTKGKIREMKNSPAKDQYDILRHVYTPKVDLEDGVFGDVEGTNKMEAIKHFQKRTDEVTEMLHFENAIESVEPLNQEEEPNYDNIQSTDEFIGTQPERQSPTELETVRETPENEMEANLDGNVGGGCNQNELEANMGGNVGEGSNENELISEDTLNVTPESNLENNKKGDDCDVDMGNIVDEGNETNLDGVLKEGDNDISKRNKENTLSQILTKMNTKKQHAMGDASRIVGGYVQATDGPQKGVKKVAHSLQEVTMIVGRKESPVTRLMDAQMEKAKTDRNNKPKRSISNDVNVDVIMKKQQHVYTKITKLSLKKGCEGMIESSQEAGYASVAGQEKQIYACCQTVIEPINAKVSVTRELQAVEKPVVESIFTGRYNVRDIIFKTSNMEIQRVAFESMHEGFAITKSVIDVWSIIQNNDERLKNKMRSKYLFCKTGMTISRNFEEFKRKFEEAMTCTNQTNLDKFDLVFFPILQAGSKANHFYLIVYNLKTLEVDIIDNKKEESQDIVRRYGEIPKRLTTSFGVYLQSVSHPNGIKMSKVKPKIMHMDWKTTTNYLDAGVFVMRHMECFYGRKNRFNAVHDMSRDERSQCQNVRARCRPNAYEPTFICS
ncbi:ulp1 protease family, C-terminal catalytic domain-containing protein [Tanacetum coccineum]|uniref:Ulp1 protease family, C-terminal catalytic domain-containing protein n=1 Tax=Tanacetum coccineum TaxID=301880 RepID=A0ABQ5CQ14_9ASTR